MNPLLLAVLCPLLGCAVVASVAAVGFTVAWLPRFFLQRRTRSLAS